MSPSGNNASDSQYAKYFFDDVIHDNKWEGEGIGLSADAKNIAPADARLSLGISVVRKPYTFHEPTHKHMFTEYFVFFGSNPLDLQEFDARADYTFGPEHERHGITSPSIVICAPGVYHCPLDYAVVNKPFYCLEAFMTTDYAGVDLGEDLTEIKVAEPNYNRYFTTGVVRDNVWGGQGIGLSAVPEHIIPAGAKINLEITAIRKPYLYQENTHKHHFTQYYFFFGTNPLDMKEFEARVEFSLGAEKEKFTITGPTVVVIPPGTFHGPVNYGSIDKPIYTLEVSMTSKYTATPLGSQLL